MLAWLFDPDFPLRCFGVMWFVLLALIVLVPRKPRRIMDMNVIRFHMHLIVVTTRYIRFHVITQRVFK